jgi:hypothetical protein
MSNSQYIQNRWKLNGLRRRPQAVAFAYNFGILDSGLLVPEGTEFENFIILSDHNRGPIDISKQRLENKQRMVSGSMRSYHIADKNTFSWSWDELPSRAFSGDPQFDLETGMATDNSLTPFTVDGGAGGVEMIKWYEDHPGSFYMFLSYDRFDKFSTDKYNRFQQYNDVVEVLFSSFEFSVSRRGGNTHDFWNISVSLEEV